LSDLDLMSDLQLWLMGSAAVVLWAVVIRTWWLNSRPRRTRQTWHTGVSRNMSVNVARGLKR